MVAKEIQLFFIKDYLKPMLKNWGYKTAGQTWWKDKGEFYTLINLQNYSWNSKHKVDFCFNVGIAVKTERITNKSLTVHDLTVYLREGFYLPDYRDKHLYRNESGYVLTDELDENSFVLELKVDFEQYILPYLEKLQSLNDCLDNFGEITFWGENLKRVMKER